MGLMSRMNNISVTHRVQRKDIWDQFAQTALPWSQDQSLRNDGVSTAHQTTEITPRYKTKLHLWSFLTNPHEALPLKLDCSDVYLLRRFWKKSFCFFLFLLQITQFYPNFLPSFNHMLLGLKLPSFCQRIISNKTTGDLQLYDTTPNAKI